MNAFNQCARSRVALACAVLITLVAALGVAHGGGGPAQSWVARWNLPETGSTNRVLGMKADRDGNLLIAGDLTETNGNTRYTLLKYTPDGRLLWATGYASAEFPPNQIRGFDVDREGNTVITGTPDTVKFGKDGKQLWLAGYGGRDVAVDRDGNALVTGWHDIRISTVKLAPSGTNVWSRLEFDFPQFAQYPQFTSYSEKVAVNAEGEVFIAGFEVFNLYLRADPPTPQWERSVQKYDASGRRLWRYGPESNASPLANRTLYGLKATPDGGAIMTADGIATVLRMGADGKQTGRAWVQVGTVVSAIDAAGNVYGSTGVNGRGYGFYKTGKITLEGQAAWIQEFDDGARDRPERYPRAVCLDGHGAVIITGVSLGPESRGDIASVAYDTETGRELWVRRYNGPANGDDEGRALVADAQGNLFLAGTSQNAAGGVDVVLIKYTAVKPVQRQGASIEVQFPGPVGGLVPVEASSNLVDWSPLASVPADADGIARYTDSNIVQSLPRRFYRSGR